MKEKSLSDDALIRGKYIYELNELKENSIDNSDCIS